jgi:hypothetical protein
MRRSSTAAVSIFACLAILGGPVAGAQNKPPDYSRMVVKVGKRSAEATLGSYCHPNEDGSGRCVDATFPLKTTGVVRVRPSGTVELLMGAGAEFIQWRAARINSRNEEVITAQGEARAVTRTYKRWRFKLPKRLSRSTDLLGFSVKYPFAYSSFEVGARVLKSK